MSFGFLPTCFITLRNLLQTALDVSPRLSKECQKKKKKKREVTTLLPSENLGANQVSWRVGDENCTEVFVLLPFQGRELSMNHSERTLKGLLPSPEN